jgi:hypothetical protein
VRTGAREVTVTKGPAFTDPALTARIWPIELRQSKVVRLERRYPKAVYKEDQHQIQLPLAVADDLGDRLVGVLRELVPLDG